MTFKSFYRLILRNWLILISIPLITGATIFFFARRMDKEYASDTVIYTGIASGVGIKADNSSDYFATTRAFANLLNLINSRETKQEVALRLLASHLMLKEYDPSVLSWKTYTDLKGLISESLKKKLVGATLEETVKNLENYLKSGEQNEIYTILNSDVAGYSLKALSNIYASQLPNSNLLRVDYTSNDAAMCRQTLEILSSVFIRKHTELMEGQNESVMKYFETATSNSYKRLEAAEESFLQFHKTNSLINYSEQASAIAADKQHMLENYNSLEMQYAGAFSALKVVERTLKERGAVTLYNQEIIELRDQLSKLNTQIAEIEIINRSRTNPTATNQLASFKQKADVIENKIKITLDNAYSKIQSAQAVVSKDLLDEWIKNTVLVEELKGQLFVIRRQLKVFGEEYNKVAPLGAELRKIEREKDLAEKEYFSLLNGLSESKLNQRNIEITSQLTVVDPPYTPIKPTKSNLLLLLLFGTFGTFFVVSAYMVGSELLDNSLRNMREAARQTGFPVLGILPILFGKSKRQVLISKRAEDTLTRQLLLKMQQKRNAREPFIIGVLSSLTEEGKSTVISILANQLNAKGIKTLALFPDDHAKQVASGTHTCFYSPIYGLNNRIIFADIIGENHSNYSVVLVEFPAVLESTYPTSLLKYLDLIVLTVRANRSWQETDQAVFEDIMKVTQAPIEVLLNGVLVKNDDTLALTKHKSSKKSNKAKLPQPIIIQPDEVLLPA
ncbi:hypothetical protein AHMF7605_25795 [Adhaeribacter arboris]|uniref:Polysaccharide chain length determinant N-terminal domain-containing protein n=1 Tax=Adhaeribacter arboris TaxID=2072846 RepID=A0A2T2YMD3_9BACT|nr:hypothetical protein [Adhaeribacter arboris]PSR56664.1 hypothetical protein AHMF7605_25795 [Adhaeribacter arboris]